MVHFGGCESHLVGVVVATRRDAREHFAKFGFVIDELQQGFAARPAPADSKYVFRGRVQVDDQEVVVEQDDARREAVEDTGSIALERAATGAVAYWRTLFC